MNKKLLIAVATLCLASVTYATQNVLIGDFEGTDDGWFDIPASAATDWSALVYVNDPSLYGTRYWFSDDWSSRVNYSLKANVNHWNWFIARDIHSDFWDNSRIEFDICAVAQEGCSATWAQVGQISLYTQTDTDMTDMADSQFTIFESEFGEAIHCVLDYSAYKTPAYASPTDTFGFFWFSYNSDAPIYLYIDNIWLTPEPATLTLLGFGGLALLRRRK